MMKISKKILVSSNTNTFLLLSPGRTVEEFKPIVSSISDFQKHANLLANYLIKLWVPTYFFESINFIPNYQPDLKSRHHKLIEVNLQNFTSACELIDPLLINIKVLEHKVKNLGALILLNLIMAGEFNLSSIGIVVDNERYFFTQKLSCFWQDFYTPKKQNLLNAKKSLEEHIVDLVKKIRDKSPDWWNLLHWEHHVFKKMILSEIFELAFRIYITPVDLVKLIYKDIFINTEQNLDFNEYLMNKISLFKMNFINILTKQQKEMFEYALKDYAFCYVEKYMASLYSYSRYNRKFIHTNNIDQFQGYMQLKAMKHNVNDLDQEHICKCMLLDLSTNDALMIFNYMVVTSVLHKEPLENDLNYFMWRMFSDLARRLSAKDNLKFKEIDTRIVYLLLKSIEFHKNDIALFFIKHMVDIVLNPIPLTLVSIVDLTGMSWGQYAKALGNTVVADYIESTQSFKK